MASAAEACRNVHPELGLPCMSKGNHERCSGFDPDDCDGDWVDWPNPNYVAPLKVPKAEAKSRLRATASRVRAAAEPAPVSGFAAGLAGSEQAADTWTDAQKKLVDDAIAAVAKRHAGGGEFTTDAIWEQLAGSVPVTKGLTARLQMARRRGLIENTGKLEISQRGGHHDHGQRLALWYSMLDRL